MLDYLIQIVEQGRHAAAVQVNTTLTVTYWLVGRAISINTLQNGRAEYGKRIVDSVSTTIDDPFRRWLRPDPT